MSTLDDLWAAVWTDENQLLVRTWIGTAIRAAILATGAWIRATGRFPYLDDATMAKIAAYAPQLAGDVMILIPIAWSAIQKWNADRKLKTALVMPSGSTAADLKTVMKTTSPGLIATAAIPTPLQAAALVDAAETTESQPKIVAV